MKIKKDKFKFSFSFNMRYWVVTLCLLFSVSLNMIGNNDHKAYTYQSFAARDFSNWPYIIETLEKEAAANPKNCAATLEIMNYYYGYIGHLLDVNNKKAADVWCKKAKKTYQALGQEYSNNADMVAYGSIITAFEIAISPVKAPLLAHSMFVGAKKSLQLDHNSPNQEIPSVWKMVTTHSRSCMRPFLPVCSVKQNHGHPCVSFSADVTILRLIIQ